MNRIILILILSNCYIAHSQEDEEITLNKNYTYYYSLNNEDSKKIKSGQWKSIKESYKVNGIKLVRQSYIDENNQVVRDFTNLQDFDDDNIRINHDKYGKVINAKSSYFNLDISQLAKTPSLTKPSENDIYFGFHDIGTYEDESGYTFTGFMLPMKLEFGNGTVLFMENESKNEYYWALILDGKLEHKVPAKKEDKPNVFLLKEQTNFELLYIPELSKEWKQQIFTDKSLIKQKQTYNFKIPTLVSNDIATKNGYGITLTSKDDVLPGDIIELKVGLFKNGKLDGLGYECTFKPSYHEQEKILYSPTGNYVQKEAEYKLQSASVSAKLGVFKDGYLDYLNKKSRRINVPDYWLTYDFWSKSEYYGLDGKFYTSNIVPNENDFVDFNSLKIGDEVFVKNINRIIKIVDLSSVSKIITLKADDPLLSGVHFLIDDKNLYAYKKTVKNYRESCSPTRLVQKYKSVKVKIFDAPVNTKTTSYTVKGIYYDKIVTTTTTTPGSGEAFYLTKYVKDGFETKKCLECHGLGYINRTSKSGYWCPIKYIEPVKKEQSTTLFDKISKSLNDNFKEKQ